MKKISFLFLLVTALGANAQDGTVFKMKYLPDHKYGAVLGMTMNLNLSMTGDDNMIAKLKAQGINLPVALNVDLKLNGDVTTGATGANNGFPLTVAYNLQDLNLEIGGNKIDPLKGKGVAIKIYAHDNADGKITADSTFVNDKRDTSKNSLSGMLNSLQSQIKFPDHPLKVGDTFTQEAPMGAAGMMGGAGSKTVVKSTYKLTGITDGKAYFDLVQTMDISVKIKTVNVSLTGTGAGKLVYSIKDNYPLSMDDKMTVKLDVTIAAMVINGTADITISSTHTIN
jgi:hypothetical protein